MRSGRNMRILHNKQQYLYFSIEKRLKGAEGGEDCTPPVIPNPLPALWMLMTKIAKCVFIKDQTERLIQLKYLIPQNSRSTSVPCLGLSFHCSISEEGISSHFRVFLPRCPSRIFGKKQQNLVCRQDNSLAEHSAHLKLIFDVYQSKVQRGTVTENFCQIVVKIIMSAWIQRHSF